MGCFKLLIKLLSNRKRIKAKKQIENKLKIKCNKTNNICKFWQKWKERYFSYLLLLLDSLKVQSIIRKRMCKLIKKRKVKMIKMLSIHPNLRLYFQELNLIQNLKLLIKVRSYFCLRNSRKCIVSVIINFKKLLLWSAI